MCIEPRARCQHCRQSPISRPRRLCWRCYYRSDVRYLYSSTSKFGRRGVGNEYRNAPAPPFPTQAKPGSAEKVAILEARAQQRVELWHPDDVVFAPVPFAFV